MTIPPTIAPVGPEWVIAPVDGPASPVAPEANGFGNVLADSIDGLSRMQTDAADAARSLADGTAVDQTSVVMAVERAQLAMQLASQIRTKAVDAINDIMHTQI